MANEQLQNTQAELRRGEAYLAEAQTVSPTGSFGLRVSIGEKPWSQETYRVRREVFVERPGKGFEFDVDFRVVTPQHGLIDLNQVIGEMIVLRGETTRYSISVQTELAQIFRRSLEIACNCSRCR
jgi:hypothetical protein